MLRELAESQLESISQQIEAFRVKLNHDTKELQDLKFVLNAKQEIADQSMAMQLMFNDVADKYRTLRMYGVAIRDSDGALVDSLPQRWTGTFFYA